MRAWRQNVAVALGALLLAGGGGASAHAQIVINEIHYDPTNSTELLEFIELVNAGTDTVDLGGWSFSAGFSYTFPSPTPLAPGAFLVVAENPTNLLRRFGVSALGPFAGHLASDGERVTLRDAAGDKVDEVTYGVGFPWPVGSAGEGGSMELINPALDNDLGGSWRASGQRVGVGGTTGGTGTGPTPGRINTVAAANAAPQIRQVTHTPQQPTTNDAIVVTARITDPDGVASATLRYQVVLPGQYIPSVLPLDHATLLADPYRPHSVNPAYTAAASWRTTSLLDNGVAPDAVAGDGIFTAALPSQALNRTLVRYTLTVTDNLGVAATVPYPDDPQLNFACFVYNGVPPYKAAKLSVHPEGAGHVYGTNVMRRLPVYTVITRAADYTECLAYSGSLQIPADNDGARRKFNWPATFVYDGEVHDHTLYRLRQRNDRYSDDVGKRAFRFKFPKTKELAARDNYGNPFPTKLRSLMVSKEVDNKNVGNFGLTEFMNFKLMNLIGVPAPLPVLFQLRLVKGADEAPASVDGQYYGDFQGMFLGYENYDARFMAAHDMPDGNLYKLKNLVVDFNTFDGNRLKRHQGRYSITSADDFQNIRRNCNASRSDQWLANHINLGHWYRYHTVCEAIRHYDFVPADTHLKNRAWFFERFDGYVNTGEVPAYPHNYGRLWDLIHDADASWGPSFNSGEDYEKNAIFSGAGKPELKKQYRNVMREFRDLVWTEETVSRWIDDLAATVGELDLADRDRWRSAPAAAGYQDFGSMAAKVQDMKNFAFVGWSGASGPTVGAGGRAKYLEELAKGTPYGENEDAYIPTTPAVTYAGGDSTYPINGLRFTCSPFADPQGAGTFAGLAWRVGDVTDMADPLFDPTRAARRWEYTPVWTSGVVTVYTNVVRLPADRLKVGRAYRVRVRMQDNSGRWSHWSAPAAFSAGAPNNENALLQNLRLTELMVAPPDPDSADYEFIELHNASTNTPLDLAGITFTAGVSFAFGNGVTLPAGGYVVVTRAADTGNFAAFRARYGLAADVLVVGPYGGKLDNAGETLTLKTAAAGSTIFSVVYEPGRGWPAAASGAGHSLAPVNLAVTEQGLDHGGNWRASAYLGGSPGRADPAPVRDVVLNEIMAHTDYVNPERPAYDSNDWIELFNAGAQAVNLGGWYLSDDAADLRKWAIPATNIIAALGWLAFDEVTGFHAPITSGFGLSKFGETIYLSHLPGNGQDRVADAVAFKGQANSVTLGRCPDGAEAWQALAATRAAANAAAGAHVLISELMYHPAPTTAHPEDNTNDEFIELHNPTAADVLLMGETGPWRVDGPDYTFPSNTVLAAGAYAVVVNFDPATNAAARAAFGAAHGLTNGQARLFGPYAGKLSNRGERIALERPIAPDLPGDPLGWEIVDEVIYFDRAPWPEGADGSGRPLRRMRMTGDGNAAANWVAGGVATPGRAPAPVEVAWPRNGAVFDTPVASLFEAVLDPALQAAGVRHVEFFSDGRLLYRDITPPFETYLDVLKTEGQHTLTVVATGLDGYQHLSQPVHVSVYGPPPPTWARRMKVTFAGYTGTETLLDFPVLVRLGPQLTGFAYSQFASAQGYDLRFQDETGVQALSYDVEAWDTNGTSCVWVRVPALRPGGHIWATWGDAALTTPPPYTQDGSTWRNNYSLVLHGAGSVRDATANATPAADHGTTAREGVVAGGRDCNGTAAYVDPGLPAGWYTANRQRLTLTAWARPDANASRALFGCEDGAQTNRFYLTAYYNRTLYWNSHLGAAAAQVGTATAGAWHFLALSLDAGQAWGQVNGGTAKALGTFVGLNLAAAPLLGALNRAGTPASFFDGTVDEVRLAGERRSADWLKAEYQTVAQAATFAAYVVQLGYSVDNDGDRLPDQWELEQFGSTNAPNGAAGEDYDGDGMRNRDEFVAGTDPRDPRNVFALTLTVNGYVPVAWFDTVAPGAETVGKQRYYALDRRTNLVTDAWQPLPGYARIPGTNQTVRFTNTLERPAFLRGRVWLDL